MDKILRTVVEENCAKTQSCLTLNWTPLASCSIGPEDGLPWVLAALDIFGVRSGLP